MVEEVKVIKKEKAIYYATGKRKCSIARVWLISGDGQIVVNDKKLDDLHCHFTYKTKLLKLLILTNTKDKYDLKVTVNGGGVSGQTDAIMYGVAKALNTISEEYHRILKQEGLLSRDARIVERKKYFRKKARKRTQYRKR